MARAGDFDCRLLRLLRAAGERGIGDADCRMHLGVGAADIADRVDALREAGFEITGSVRGGGFRLVSAPGRLIADDLRASLPIEAKIGGEILVFNETDSTNDLAARAGQDGVDHGLVIFAETQRAGRGRLGRLWESPRYQGLWMSLLLRPAAVPSVRWPELTFCAALAVAETAELATGLPARIKWPNDVTLNGRKIAGILLECHQAHHHESHHGPSSAFVVVGIGLNVLQRLEDFHPDLRDRAGSLAMMSPDRTPMERRAVATALLERFERLYARWPDEFGSIMAACTERGCVPPSESPRD